jgi:hypothetical protein
VQGRNENDGVSFLELALVHPAACGQTLVQAAAPDDVQSLRTSTPSHSRSLELESLVSCNVPKM